MLIEDWRRVWRTGLAPVLPTAGLEAVRDYLRRDDPRLIQGGTSVPPPLMAVQDWPVEAACVLGLCGTVEHGGFGTATVGEVEEFFARRCWDCDQATGEPASVKHWLNHWDDTPRAAAIADLLPEVERELERRAAPAAA